MTRPKPWQVGQAPSGELNAKSGRRGVAEVRGRSAGSGVRGGTSARGPRCAATSEPAMAKALSRPRRRSPARDSSRTTNRPTTTGRRPSASRSGSTVVADLDGLSRRARRARKKPGPLQLREPDARPARRGAASRGGRRPRRRRQATGATRSTRGALLGRSELLDRPVHAARHGGDAAVGAERRSAVGEEQPQRVVDLGLRPDGRTGVAHAVLLLERDRRRHRLDRVHVGPVEPLQELPRIGRERLGVRRCPSA